MHFLNEIIENLEPIVVYQINTHTFLMDISTTQKRQKIRYCLPMNFIHLCHVDSQLQYCKYVSSKNKTLQAIDVRFEKKELLPFYFNPWKCENIRNCFIYIFSQSSTIFILLQNFSQNLVPSISVEMRLLCSIPFGKRCRIKKKNKTKPIIPLLILQILDT